jgi:hypothetical protein
MCTQSCTYVGLKKLKIYITPKSNTNLLCLGDISAAGYRIEWNQEHDEFTVTNDEEDTMIFRKEDNLYTLVPKKKRVLITKGDGESITHEKHPKARLRICGRISKSSERRIRPR